MSIFIAEMIGTFILILLGNGVVANVLLTRSKGYGGGWICISAGWGFAVAIGVYTMGWVSGGHINPAVTLGFALIGRTPASLIPLYLAGQMVGAMIGQLFVWFTYYKHWEKTEDPNMKLVCFCTKPAIPNVFWNFITEVIGTGALLLGILGIINGRNGLASGFGPFAIGILIYSIGLSLGGPTGYAINPARDLGPRIMYAILPIQGKGRAEWSYAWIPVIGPIVGGLLGALLYQWFINMVAH